MQAQRLVRAVQRAYPQIWFACHVEHRARPGEDALTDREAGILAHLEASPALRATDLARHLGIGRPALSAQLKRLAALGLVESTADAADRRERRIRLSTAGERRLAADSPLAADRVLALLSQLSADERARAVAGLELLAEAARRLARTAAEEEPAC